LLRRCLMMVSSVGALIKVRLGEQVVIMMIKVRM
jgi:hypothetical protein